MDTCVCVVAACVRACVSHFWFVKLFTVNCAQIPMRGQLLLQTWDELLFAHPWDIYIPSLSCLTEHAALVYRRHLQDATHIFSAPAQYQNGLIQGRFCFRFRFHWIFIKCTIVSYLISIFETCIIMVIRAKKSVQIILDCILFHLI